MIYFICRDSLCLLAGFVKLAREICFRSEQKHVEQSVSTAQHAAKFSTCMYEGSSSLSVHQLVAFQTLTMVNKVITISKPAYLAKRLKLREENGGMVPGRNQATILPLTSSQTLSVTRVDLSQEELSYSTTSQ